MSLNSNPSTTPSAQILQQLQPSYLSQMFANGLPQVSATTVDPSSGQSQGATPVNAAPYGAQAMTQQILTADQPLWQQQNAALNESLADAGIVGGSTLGAQGALDNQQQQQLLSQIAPIQQEANAQQIGVLQGNQSSQQQNNQFNATNALNALLQNAGILNNASNTNTSNELATAGTDASTANNLASQILGLNNTDWLQQLQDQYGLDTGAASGQQSAFVPVYQQPSQGIFGDLGTIDGGLSTGGAAKQGGVGYALGQLG